MKENTENKISLSERIKAFREKYLPYNEKTLHRLVIAALVMYVWMLIWALVFKMGNEVILKNLYINLKDMTLKERILWDLIPFNYRSEYGDIKNIVLDTILNCFVLTPFAVLLCYAFKKPNVWCGALICLGLSTCIELIQMMTMLGNPATEDLITNTVGYFIGYGLYMLLFRRLSVKYNVIIAVIVNIILAIASVYALISILSITDLLYQFFTRTL